MKLWLFAAGILALAPFSAHAQNAQRIPTCGTGAPPAGISQPYMDAAGNLCTSGSSGNAGSGTASTLTDRSGTITLGGTAQTLMAANTSRHGCILQNQSTGDMWLNETGSTAVLLQPSVWLPAGSVYTCPIGGASTAAFSLIGATTGQAFMAREW